MKLLILAALAAAAPQEARGVLVHEDAAFDGYTLLAPLRSSTTYLIDMEGEVVHTWESDQPPCSSVYLLPNGHLLRPVRLDSDTFFAGGQGGRIVEMDWDGKVVWQLDWNDARTMQHHDLHPRANGNLLFIAWEHNTREAALALGRDPAVVDDRGFWTCAVFEVEPDRERGEGGRVVWEWHSRDHLIQDRDPALAGHGDVTAHPELIDVNADHRARPPVSPAERERLAKLEEEMRAVGYVGEDEEEDGEEDPEVEPDFLHLNAIDLHEGLDLIALSSPHMNEVWIVDRGTTTEEAAGHAGGRRGHGGDLLYRWGNARTYGVDEPQRFFYQHDVRWIPDDCPGAGNLLVFNNGGGRPDGSWSSVEELSLPWGDEEPFEREGPSYGPTEPSWSYAADPPGSLFSGFISGAHRLPNGDTLICSGVDGRVLEVTREGRVAWELLNPFAGSLAPMGKRPASHRDPEEEPPPPPSESDNNEMLRYGLFRATRLAPDHPGLSRLKR